MKRSQIDSSKQLNHKLTLRITSFILVLLATTCIIRPIFVSLPWYFTFQNIANFLMFLGVYFFIRSEKHPKYEVTLLLSCSIIAITPSILLSGGVNSQFTSLLPLYPILAALLGGRIESISAGITLTIGVFLCTLYGENIQDLTNDIYTSEKSIPRGIWLMVAILFSTFFGQVFLTRHKHFTQKLQQESILDPLTSVLNRRGFNQILAKDFQRALVNRSDICIILIDIDFFKNINDTYGHKIGDQCLIEIADTLSKSLRITDSIGRFGGEEFIVLLPRTALLSAVKVAEQLRQDIEQRTFSDEKISLTITAGVSTFDSHDYDENSIIQRADIALYEGKKLGRNLVIKG
ncbi:GGDEF domain-containing protein [Marinomonas epiphytica]